MLIFSSLNHLSLEVPATSHVVLQQPLAKSRWNAGLIGRSVAGLAKDVRAELHSCTMARLEPVLDSLPQVIVTHVEIRAARWHHKQLLVIRPFQPSELARVPCTSGAAHPPRCGRGGPKLFCDNGGNRHPRQVGNSALSSPTWKPQ